MARELGDKPNEFGPNHYLADVLLRQCNYPSDELIEITQEYSPVDAPAPDSHQKLRVQQQPGPVEYIHR